MSNEKKLNPHKGVIIDSLVAKVNASPFVLVFDYTGVTVPEFTELRAALAAAGAKCEVAKNTFMAKAIASAGLPDISASLKGQTAYIMGNSDVCAAAKAVNTFAKKSKKAAWKAGILDGAELSADKIKALGDLLWPASSRPTSTRKMVVQRKKLPLQSKKRLEQMAAVWYQLPAA